ncbi:MAG: hypothetical protein WC476_05070 [Phycisphaerae bacterium]|jgi:hypothetical protein
MNKKQLIVMWVGIGAIILGLLVLLNASYVNSPYVGGFDGFRVIPCQIFLFVLWVFGVVIITAGLIVTFDDKKKEDS